MITVFANMRINDEIRLQHMKDSFMSFKDISDDWVINIRGTFRDEAIKFLKENFGDKLTLFELLDDKRGWLTNSLEMLPYAKYDYVLVCNEDHINISPKGYLQNVIKEIIERKVDYMMYSYYPFWSAKLKNFAKQNEIENGNYIDIININKKNISRFFPKTEKTECVVVAAGIFPKSFFKKLMKSEQHKLPIIFTRYLYRIMTGLNMAGINFNQRKAHEFINKLLFYKVSKWSKEVPFELEITNDRRYVLPVRLAHPKKEIFVCIDDDLAVPGYQLVKRGLYPHKPSLQISSGNKKKTIYGSEELLEQNNDYTIQKVLISKGQEINERYYEDNVRTNQLMRKTIVVINGNIHIKIDDRELNLQSGQVTTIYPHIRYIIKAQDDSQCLMIFTSIYNKKIKTIT